MKEVKAKYIHCINSKFTIGLLECCAGSLFFRNMAYNFLFPDTWHANDKEFCIELMHCEN